MHYSALILKFPATPFALTIAIQGVNLVSVSEGLIPNGYLVYNDDAETTAIEAYESGVYSILNKRTKVSHGIPTKINLTGFKSSHVETDSGGLAQFGTHPLTAGPIWPCAFVTQVRAPWGLRKTSHRAPGNQNYHYDCAAGTGTQVYVAYSGNYVDHQVTLLLFLLSFHVPHFGGRAVWGAIFINGSLDADEKGYSTRVAETTGSNTMDKSAINVSLCGSTSVSQELAITAITQAGVTVVAFAGNTGDDAHLHSPGNATDAITVGAIDQTNKKQIGASVLSIWFAYANCTKLMDSMSMATPHAAGLAAFLIANGRGRRQRRRSGGFKCTVWREGLRMKEMGVQI
ncbi:subtilisin-like protein [Lepidopterella palustris CBS 459.81]|uniref:Subtilisin-like protein n=1 Tax=Lepidopterella palustris CBS 459.81 TaxID=1314670 RepID=A0A8E2JF19_9PEZI|nr:subtilisin-like protein [Lepidopterella palustris CBS 459.81]